MVWRSTSTSPPPAIAPGTYAFAVAPGPHPADDWFDGASAEYAVVDDTCQPIHGVDHWGLSLGAFYQAGTRQGTLTISSVSTRLAGTVDYDLGGPVHFDFDVPMCNLDDTEAALDPAAGPPIFPPYTCGQ